MRIRRPDRKLGGDHDIFWKWCNDGELRLPHCAQCGHITWPVAENCEKCGRGPMLWEKMSGKGTLAAWCGFERDYYKGLMADPYEVIVVYLECRALFMSNPLGFRAEENLIGSSLELRFLDCEDSTGPFRLPVFALA